MTSTPTDLLRVLRQVVDEQRPCVLVSIVDGQLEILFTGDPSAPEPITWAEVATILAYAAQCARSNAGR